MAARRTLRRFGIAVLMCTLLLVPVGCDLGDSSGKPTAPTACTSERTRSSTMHDIATVSRGVEVGPLDVVVSRTGKATLAWTAAPGGFDSYRPQVVRIADDPAAPGDPHFPPGPPDPQDPLDAQVNAVTLSFPESPSGSLDIDGSDRQTLLWEQDLLTPPGPEQVFTEFYDVVTSERAPGGGWSTSPVLGFGFVSRTQLAVNASGAAVVAWERMTQRANGPGPFRVFASYRDAAGAGWTSPERVPNTETLEQVGIDDEGRVLLMYRGSGRKGDDSLKVVRRSRAGRWGKPQRVGGPSVYQYQMALGAGGTAVVAYSREDEQFTSRMFTSRMSPDGTWAAPVRQPGGLPVVPPALDMDAEGRALTAWWHGADLMVRWSQADGQWRKPCVLAADVSKPRRSELDTQLVQLVVNRRGDALVVWRAKGRVAQLWARHKPAGRDWTRPVKMTPTDSPPQAYFVAGLGDRGHAAVAWTTRNNRQIQVRRLTPTP
jgi:hypothetical protein